MLRCSDLCCSASCIHYVCTYLGTFPACRYFWLILINLFFTPRYFTGHTTNPDGTVQFVKGHTSVKSIIFGVIKILTVAVCNDLMFGVS
jgi:hypothetical protein